MSLSSLLFLIKTANNFSDICIWHDVM